MKWSSKFKIQNPHTPKQWKRFLHFDFFFNCSYRTQYGHTIASHTAIQYFTVQYAMGVSQYTVSPVSWNIALCHLIFLAEEQCKGKDKGHCHLRNTWLIDLPWHQDSFDILQQTTSTLSVMSLGRDHTSSSVHRWLALLLFDLEEQSLLIWKTLR